MKERARELKAEARRGALAQKADGESDVLAKIAEMPQPDRVMPEPIHALVKASAPALSPRTWYGMPAYAKDGNVVCSKARTGSSRGTRRSVSATRRISAKAPYSEVTAVHEAPSWALASPVQADALEQLLEIRCLTQGGQAFVDAERNETEFS
jgi:hypothetical protein